MRSDVSLNSDVDRSVPMCKSEFRCESICSDTLRYHSIGTMDWLTCLEEVQGALLTSPFLREVLRSMTS